MRLSQTPEDISDHQRRVSDPRRINLGVGAAWMSGKLEPRAWPGENRWGFGASVTPRYPQVGQPTGAIRTMEWTADDVLNNIIRLYSEDRIVTTEQVVQRIMKDMRVDRNAALQLYNGIRSRLVKKAPSDPGLEFEPATRPQDALPAGKTFGGRTTIKKRRSGESDRPEEARIFVRWGVENQGDATAKASLRLRMGATRILATSLPVDVVAGTRSSLLIRWSIPSDMALGGHSLALDIMQTWQVDGVSYKKIVAIHELTVDVVAGKRAPRGGFARSYYDDSALLG